VLVRYQSFFDIAQAAESTLTRCDVLNVPTYITCYFRTGEPFIRKHQAQRREALIRELAATFGESHVVEQPDSLAKLASPMKHNRSISFANKLTRRKKRSDSDAAISELGTPPSVPTVVVSFNAEGESTEATSDHCNECCGNDYTEIGCYETALVEEKKGGGMVVVPRKKYRHIHFFDQCTLEFDPRALNKYVLSHTSDSQNTYPVLLVNYTDIVEPATQLTTLLRQIPQCTVIGVPAVHMRAVAKKLMTVHDAFLKSLHKSGVCYDLRDRYQYLMTMIRAALKSLPGVPVCVLNAPIAFPPAFITSATTSYAT